MRLASFEVIPYALPFKQVYVTARGALARREMVLLRLRDEDGRVGLGEAVPLSLRGGTTIEQVVGELEDLGERVARRAARAGDGASPAAGGERGLLGASPLSAPARCALETALMDLRGRRAGDAAEALPPIPCNATLTAGPPAEVVAQAEGWATDGFTTFKLKLGAESAKGPAEDDFSRTREGDVGQVRAVREALGPEARIRVDVNGAWDLETATELLEALEPYDIELAEQPVGTLEEMAELSRATSIPLAADESVASVEQARRAAELGACACTGVKLSKVGGPQEALAIAAALPAYLSSALDGPVGIAAAAHIARQLAVRYPEGPRLAHGLATQRLFAASVAAIGCELRDGLLFPPPGPGLGVEIDEDALQAHRL